MSTQERDLTPLYKILGPKGLTQDTEICHRAGQDWRGVYQGPVLAIAWPSTPQQAAAVVQWAGATQTPLVPQGGNSSLSGGAVPLCEGPPAVVLSSARLRQVRALDRDQRVLVAETGLILQEIQERVAPLEVPVDLGGRGTAQLGGLLACHAGGLNVVRYGSLRAHVRGLEVVLPNGDIWHGLSQVKKDNSGFDLKSLFIGSEGTLGFITAVCLQLHPPSAHRLTSLIGLTSPQQALEVFWALEAAFSGHIRAAELMPQVGMARALAHKADLTNPFAVGPLGAGSSGAGSSGARSFSADLPPYALLLEIDLRAQLQEAETDLALGILTQAGGEVLIAQNEAQARAFWDLRECLVLAQGGYGPSLKHDVCVPLPQVPKLLEIGSALAQEHLPGCAPVPFGHLGDGSFHFNISCPPGWTAAELQTKTQAQAQAAHMTQSLHDLVHELGGSISAEHGLGQARRDEAHRLRDPAATKAMQAIKQALDPAGIFNPGKVLNTNSLMNYE